MVAHHILGDHGGAQAGDQLVDAVVDLRVQVVGTAAQNDDRQLLAPCLGDHLVALPVDAAHVRAVLVIRSFGRFLHLVEGNSLKVAGKDLMELHREIVPAVNAHIIVDKGQPIERRHVCGDHFRVIGHNRAVVMVVPQLFIEVVGHAGIENRLHAAVHQFEDMAVHELGREAHGVARNGALSFQIELAA